MIDSDDRRVTTSVLAQYVCVYVSRELVHYEHVRRVNWSSYTENEQA